MCLSRYAERKAAGERALAATAAELDCRHRFCQAVVSGRLVLFGRARAEVENELKVRSVFSTKRITRRRREKLTSFLQAMGLAEHSGKGGFGYLLSTAVVDLTRDKLAELEEKLAAARAQLEVKRTHCC